MYVEIDIGTVPPRTTLREADEFQSFKVVVRTGTYVYVDQDWLRAARTGDADWGARLDEMLAYAESKGWMGSDGRVRAHVERSTI
jgi:hypothetical protein